MKVFVARDDVSPDVVTKSLQALLPSRHHPMAHRRFTALDTFDGRVRRAGAQLTSAVVGAGPVLTWEPADGRGHVAMPLSQAADFEWNLPGGPLRRTLAPVIGVRRLLPQAEIEAQGSELDVLDERGKTVARLRIMSGQVRLPDPGCAWTAFPTLVCLTNLRGYEDESGRLARVIESRPSLTRAADGAHRIILRHAGAPEPFSSSPRLSLSPEVRADEGARLIHRALVGILRANEPGILARLDTEFLHDYRVIVRRIRALLRQIKQVFPAGAVEGFSNEFSWLSRLTGPPRDLDVLVLALREHEDLTVEDRRVLLEFLAERQDDEYRVLTDALANARYQQLMADWQSFLERPAREPAKAENASKPFAEVLARRAWRLLRRIGRAAETVHERTPAADLHDVRIDAKKLRYLIDLAPGIPDAGLDEILGSLKKVQRILGDFNDAHVQAARLAGIGHAFGAAGGPPSAVLGIGRLAGQCRQRRAELRPRIARALSAFSTRDTRSAYRRTFRRMAEPAP